MGMITTRRMASASALMEVVVVMAVVAVAVYSQSGPDTVHAQAAVPAAPTGLTTTSVSHDSVTLGWDDPDDGSITGYLVLRRDVVNQGPARSRRSRTTPEARGPPTPTPRWRPRRGTSTG